MFATRRGIGYVEVPQRPPCLRDMRARASELLYALNVIPNYLLVVGVAAPGPSEVVSRSNSRNVRTRNWVQRQLQRHTCPGILVAKYESEPGVRAVRVIGFRALSWIPQSRVELHILASVAVEQRTAISAGGGDYNRERRRCKLEQVHTTKSGTRRRLARHRQEEG